MKSYFKKKIQLVGKNVSPCRFIGDFDDFWQSDLAQLDICAKSNKNFKFISVSTVCEYLSARTFTFNVHISCKCNFLIRTIHRMIVIYSPKYIVPLYNRETSAIINTTSTFFIKN